MRLLIIEDQQETLQILGTLFTLEGHTVTLTKMPSEGLAHIASNTPDVILLDIGLPGMDGYQIARAIRAMDLKPRPLIIAYSGYSTRGDIAKGHEAGFDFHFPKTVSPQTLLNVIQEQRIKAHPADLADADSKVRPLRR